MKKKTISFKWIVLIIFIIILSINSNIYATTISLDDSGFYIINNIKLAGNKLTKDKIIYREITFQIRDSIGKNNLDQEISKSKENLLNTTLFNFVTFEKINIDSTYINIYVILEERWYIWPNPIFEYYDRNLSSFIHNKDWSRINYGLYISHNNFRGRKEILRLKFRIGYKEHFAIYYHKPNLDKDQKHGITADLSYFRRHESDLKTENNQVMYFKDKNQFLWQQLGLRLIYYYRPLYYNTHKLSIQYDQFKIADTLAFLNPDYLSNGNIIQKIPAISYQFIRDKRDSKPYPLKGYYLDIFAKIEGFNIPSLNDYNNSYIKAVISYYGKLSNSLFYSNGIKWKLSSNNNPPYFRNYALGYSDFMHGFEYYVIDGPHYLISKSYLKYELISPRVTELRYVPLKKFRKVHYALYTNLFFDFGYVNNKYADPSNNMTNKLLYSTGFGIDYVTYYDIVVRFELAINQFGEYGFYLHLDAPILKGN